MTCFSNKCVWLPCHISQKKLQKWLYLIEICFIQRFNLCSNRYYDLPLIAFVNFDEGFEKLYSTFILYPWLLSMTPVSFISIKKSKTSLIALSNTIYFLSVVIESNYVCNRLVQNIGQLKYVIIYTVLDKTNPGSIYSDWFHPPSRSTSA